MEVRYQAEDTLEAKGLLRLTYDDLWNTVFIDSTPAGRYGTFSVMHDPAQEKRSQASLADRRPARAARRQKHRGYRANGPSASAATTLGKKHQLAFGHNARRGGYRPRLMASTSDRHVGRPFPASVTITNGFLPLDHVSIFIRPCSVLSSQGNSRIVGSSNCSRANTGGGGITRPEWREKHLALDERWNVPLGRTVPFTFDTGEADILLVITYWRRSNTRHVSP